MMTPTEPPDPIDGDTDSPVRREALRLIGRSADDLSDFEHLMRQTEAYWWLDYCLARFQRLPVEIEPRLTCRQFTHLQAHAVVSDAYARLAKAKAHYLREDKP